MGSLVILGHYNLGHHPQALRSHKKTLHHPLITSYDLNHRISPCNMAEPDMKSSECSGSLLSTKLCFLNFFLEKVRNLESSVALPIATTKIAPLNTLT